MGQLWRGGWIGGNMWQHVQQMTPCSREDRRHSRGGCTSRHSATRGQPARVLLPIAPQCQAQTAASWPSRPPGWLEAASVAASLEDARLAAITALKALLTTAHKQWAAGGSSKGGASAATVAGGSISTAVVQAALAVVADTLADVANCTKERAGNAVQAAAAEAAAVDPAGAHLSNLAEAAYCLLLLVQRWGGGGAAAVSAAEEDAAAALCAGLLQATG